MSAADHVDGKYYQVLAPQSLAERLAIKARDQIYADFIRLCQPDTGDSILDLGVSDVVNDAANVMERLYPFPHKVTAAGLGTGADFRAAHPAVTYVKIEANRSLPFPDKAFEVATSNAVLEHVGSAEHQQFFVDEIARVAKRVFITVPHRFFPVEHHTAIPLLHFWDGSFSAACRVLGKTEWMDQRNLILMTRSRLVALSRHYRRSATGYTGLRLGPFSSNLYLHIGT
jgi:ubiquinone/menaquinone biosynthesis C-methylase UbiE